MDKLKYIIENLDGITHIFQTPLVGTSVDNGCGMDFELDEFAVFVEEGGNRKDSIKVESDYWDEYNIELGIMAFTNVEKIEGLSKELKDRDGYELVWKK